MTNHEDKILSLLREWQALDELAMAQAATSKKTCDARDSKWSELLYEARKRPSEVLR